MVALFFLVSTKLFKAISSDQQQQYSTRFAQHEAEKPRAIEPIVQTFEFLHSEERSSVDWRKIDVDSMTSTDIFNYLKWGNESSCTQCNYFGGKVSRTARRAIEGQKSVCLNRGWLDL